ncbi:ATP-dependent RNA helicase RhlE [Pseudoalteromonas sp. MBR-15]|jgi:ATP-dependent RNA helicase RhlE|uniref:DEAD/DEAH box helicase n=1 Tax=Pseudoalteromonas TaxID=53246 RepID=UPI00082458FC|nr:MULTISPECIES: DEAD/DEAH box helicase [Pseudoalteromonas]MCC9660991.1 DEAD/DEAH box helicase [Pseudoalteromonas sp. MB41]QMW15668.1 DEAD/DEAH box helicase [Pseudoalteromonas sp. MT33b]
MSFDGLGLSQSLVNAVLEKGYETPTPIQTQAIPAIIAGRDVMAAAQTGTGKTAGFTLPLIERLAKGKKASGNRVRALVLAPTRELALQVSENVEEYAKHSNISSFVVYGGVKINPQMMRLRKGVDILVATPGRLLDLHNQNALQFDTLEVLVLDEADRMLDMGFIHDIKRIIAKLPTQRQNLMFSATFSDEIRALAKGLINDPVEISVAAKNTTAKTVSQSVYAVDKSRKTALLSHLIRTNNWQQVLVFSRTKHGANRLVKQLERDDIVGAAIHGNKSQGARVKALEGFKNGEVRVLVATDIVARGLDIVELPHVINYDLPNVYEDYVHRIGRTGRAGASGHAISFVTAEDAIDLYGIERFIGELIPRATEAGFEPSNPVPERELDARPIKPKKPKKAKQPFSKPKSDSKKPNSNGSGIGPRRGGSGKKSNATKGSDEQTQSPWAKRQSVGGNAQRKRRPKNGGSNNS